MVTWYDYVMAVWLRFEMKRDSSNLEDELREYLEQEFQVNELKSIDESEDEIEVSLKLQVTFSEAQMMQEGEPTDEAIAELDQELRAFLARKYQVSYLELLDDALTSYLLGEWEDDEVSEN